MLYVRFSLPTPRSKRHNVFSPLNGSHARRMLVTCSPLSVFWHCGAHSAEPNIGPVRPIPPNPKFIYQNSLFSIPRNPNNWYCQQFAVFCGTWVAGAEQFRIQVDVGPPLSRDPASPRESISLHFSVFPAPPTSCALPARTLANPIAR